MFGGFRSGDRLFYGEVRGEDVHVLAQPYWIQIQLTGEVMPLANVQIDLPFAPSKLIAVGLNYADHIAEMKRTELGTPLIWFKSPSSLLPHNGAIEIAFPEHQTDFEVELAVVIGKTTKNIAAERALDFVFGYTIGLDISDRDLQKSEKQFGRCKSFDTYTPIGPFVYADFDASDVSLELWQNGELRQSTRTSRMIYSVAEIISFASHSLTLLSGDVILTGTPAGVGPIRAGDKLEAAIDGRPRLRNRVVAARCARIAALKESQQRELERLALHPGRRDISNQRCDLDRSVAEKMKSFARLATNSSAIRGNLLVSKSNRSDQTPASTMKTLLATSLCTFAFALISLAQSPPPAQAPPAAGTNPAARAPTNPAAAQQAPGTNVPPGQAAAPGQPAAQQSAAPGQPGAVGQPAAPGQPGAVGQPAAPGAVTSPAPAGAESPAAAAAASAPPPPAPAAETKPAGFFAGNWLIDKFHKGGPVMWPILIVSIIALTVVIERIFWWSGRWFRRDPKRIEKVFTAIEHGDTTEASRLSRGSRDPVLRMMWNGLNHQHASLQGALQVAAGIEIKRAGRFLVVMDTLVTLAPLLGLLGTITGLIRSFSFLGNEELAVQAVTGGIAEALIATACGLGIAIFALIPFNFFTSRVSNLEFELQTAATNLEVMLGAQTAARELDFAAQAPASGKGSSI